MPLRAFEKILRNPPWDHDLVSTVTREALDVLKEDAAKLYARRGFQTRIGFGRRPAVVVIDLARGWTDPRDPLGANLDAVVQNTNEVLRVARPKRKPMVFTTIAYEPNSREADLLLIHIHSPR